MLLGTKVNGNQTVLKWYVLSVCMAVGMNLCGGGT